MTTKPNRGNMSQIYNRLMACLLRSVRPENDIGQVVIDHQESDLYVLKTSLVDAVIETHKREGYPLSYSPFVSEKDGQVWYDFPFQYLPFWERKQKERN